MSVEEIKKQIKEHTTNKFRADDRLSDAKNRIKVLSNKLETAKSEAEIEVVRQERAARDSHIRGIVVPLQQRLDRSKIRLVELESSREDKLAMVSREQILNKIVGENLKGLSAYEEIRERLREEVGEPLFDEFVRNLDSDQTLSGKELASTIDKMNSQVSSLVRDKKGISRSAVEQFSVYIDSLIYDGEEEENSSSMKRKGLISGGMVAIALLAMPLYSSFLAVKAISDTRRYSLLASTIRDCVIVEANIERLKRAFESKAEKEEERLLDSIEKSYSQEINETEKLIDSLEGELDSAESKALESFSFDSEAAMRIYQGEISSLEKDLETARNQLNSETEMITSLSFGLTELRDRLDQATENLKYEYLNFDKPGMSREFDEKILLDFDQRKNPLFFKMDHSSMFLYNEIDVVKSFIRLCTAQIRSRLFPNAYSIYLWDIDYMAVYFNQFEDKEGSICTSYTTVEKIAECLSLLHQTLERKNKVVLHDNFKNIKDYNEQMLKEQSVPETYAFLFIVNPRSNLLSSDELAQLASVGADVGIYVNVFVPEGDLGETYLPLVDKVDRIHGLYESSISQNAKEMIVKQIKGLEP